MPIHDWTRVDAGIFHAFHLNWIAEVSRALNRGALPRDYYALPEQIAGRYGPDVLTLQGPADDKAARKARPRPGDRNGVVAIEERPPKARFHIADAPKWYAGKKKSVVIRHITGHRIVAVLEIISPGNKDSKTGLEELVRKARDLIYAGIHLVLIDLFPPTARDPEGIHPVVWGEDDGDTFRFDRRKPLTCASYVGGSGAQAFIFPIGVGDRLPDVPIFLTPFEYVDTPLETTYRAAFDALPDYWQDVMSSASKRK
jgi:Protein of unknown function (DUF4058)